MTSSSSSAPNSSPRRSCRCPIKAGEAPKLAHLAINRAIARLEGEATDDEREVVITPRLIIRSTTAAPSRP